MHLFDPFPGLACKRVGNILVEYLHHERLDKKNEPTADQPIVERTKNGRQLNDSFSKIRNFGMHVWVTNMVRWNSKTHVFHAATSCLLLEVSQNHGES